jgi:hypothetical protein
MSHTSGVSFPYALLMWLRGRVYCRYAPNQAYWARTRAQFATSSIWQPLALKLSSSDGLRRPELRIAFITRGLQYAVSIPHSVLLRLFFGFIIYMFGPGKKRKCFLKVLTCWRHFRRK